MQKTDFASVSDKRESILQATLEVMAEHGFEHAPMSLICKRAKASPGIIYHYFDSKEELIESVYKSIYGNSLRAIETADSASLPLKGRFEMMWMTVYRYFYNHPLEIAFLDQYENSPIAHRTKKVLSLSERSLAELPVENLSLDQLLEVLLSPEFQNQLSCGEKILVDLMAEMRRVNLIKDLHQAAISEFVVYVPRRLARQAAEGYVELDEESLTAIAEACWRAIAR
jgi:AcrR family transcriptional regulator